jgi:hypothetical protein
VGAFYWGSRREYLFYYQWLFDYRFADAGENPKKSNFFKEVLYP